MLRARSSNESSDRTGEEEHKHGDVMVMFDQSLLYSCVASEVKDHGSFDCGYLPKVALAAEGQTLTSRTNLYKGNRATSQTWSYQTELLRFAPNPAKKKANSNPFLGTHEGRATLSRLFPKIYFGNFKLVRCTKDTLTVLEPRWHETNTWQSFPALICSENCEIN